MSSKSLYLILALLTMATSLSSCASLYQVTSSNTNQCMNVENHGSPVPGTPLRVRPCDPWQNQKWSFNNGQIVGVGGFCVDVQGSSPVDGAAVIFVPCDGRPSQIWSSANGTIVGIAGKCIDIAGALPETAAALVIATCTGAPSQQWMLH